MSFPELGWLISLSKPSCLKHDDWNGCLLILLLLLSGSRANWFQAFIISSASGFVSTIDY
jgi:hypothetical protein